MISVNFLPHNCYYDLFYVYMCTYTHKYMYTCIYMYIYMYIYIHMHIYIYIDYIYEISILKVSTPPKLTVYIESKPQAHSELGGGAYFQYRYQVRQTKGHRKGPRPHSLHIYMYVYIYKYSYAYIYN